MTTKVHKQVMKVSVICINFVLWELEQEKGTTECETMSGTWDWAFACDVRSACWRDGWCLFFFFFPVLGLEFRAFLCTTTWDKSLTIFVLLFHFCIGRPWSQFLLLPPPKYLRLQVNPTIPDLDEQKHHHNEKRLPKFYHFTSFIYRFFRGRVVLGIALGA
jgi:hypothetical protein